MGQFGGFYKGEKKKKKKGGSDSQHSITTSAPVFVPPRIIGKSKKEE